MNAARTIVSSTAVAASMGAALLVSTPAVSAAPLVAEHRVVATVEPPTAGLLPIGCGIPILCTNPPNPGSPGGTSGGTSTPELPSAALVGIGLIPPLLVGAVWRRRNRPR